MNEQEATRTNELLINALRERDEARALVAEMCQKNVQPTRLLEIYNLVKKWENQT